MSQEPTTYSLFLLLFSESWSVKSYSAKFQAGSHVWTDDLSHRVLAYLNSRNVAFTISSLQAAVENHLEQRLHQPQKLLEDLRKTDAQQFRTAMKCLLEDKKDRLDLKDIIIDLGEIRERALQSPGSEPQPVSHHTREVFPGDELPGVCGDPGQGAEGVLRQLSPARHHRAAPSGPARGCL
ncbi:hypothetical protein H8959_001740 [Pygathrix nigripes]